MCLRMSPPFPFPRFDSSRGSCTLSLTVANNTFSGIKFMSENATADAAFAIPQELIARCVGRVDLAQRVIKTFVQQLTEDLPSLSREIQDRKPDNATKIAHRVKGAAANVAAESLRSDAATLETLTREGEFESAEAVLESLEANWRDYLESVAPFIASD